MDIYDFTDAVNRDIIVMDKNNPPLSDNEDINDAIKKILDNLRIEDLKKEYRKKHEEGKVHELYGHCWVATEALWDLLKEKNINDYKPHFVLHEDCSHWFLKNIQNGDVIDVTAGQFKTPVSYHGGSKRVRTKGRRLVMMREDDVPNDRAKKLLERIKSGK